MLVQMPLPNDGEKAARLDAMEAAMQKVAGLGTFRDADSGNIDPLLQDGWRRSLNLF